MQIAPALSYLPYVARPSESNGAASIASSARSGASTPENTRQVVGTQPAATNQSGDSRTPTETEHTTRVNGGEASTARAGDPSANVARRGGQEATDTDERNGKNTHQDPTAAKGANGQTLTPEAIAELKDLQVRDREVRNHELAHQIVGGQFAGGANYTFERGPDGGRYAVAGEVPIDVGVIPGDPQATIEKMRKVRAAALAPAEPSAQDRAIAAKASQTMMAAQLELTLQRREVSNGENTTHSTTEQSRDTSQVTQRESNKAIQAYQSMASGLLQHLPSADPPWAMA